MNKTTLSKTGMMMGLALLAAQGCGTPCSDDGFVWQQNSPDCQQQSSMTEDASQTDPATSAPTASATETASASDTDPTGGTQGGGQLWCKDADGDGFGDPTMCQPEMFPGSVPNGDDCADDNADAFPGAAEQDSMTECMQDADGDGYGDTMPPPGVTPGTDCADDNANAFPGAAEKDSPDACMEDADEDGYGDDMPGPGVEPGTDCNDDNSSIFPGAATDLPGVCAQDSDGDGFGDSMPTDPDVPAGTDCGQDDPNTFPGSAPNDSETECMTDADGDDWGDSTPSSPGAIPGSDCADDNPNAFPGSAENEVPADACMEDEDGDGYGDSAPPPGVDPGSDCLDTDPDAFPGASENENPPDACTKDADGDGFGDSMPPPGVDPGTDCLDSDLNTFPGSAPNDSQTECMTDEDGDNWGDAMPEPGVKPGSDCADSDPNVYKNCAPCTPNEVKCVGDQLHTCNMQGNSENIVSCDHGCDDQGLKCWDVLSVDAGDSICVDVGKSAQLNAVTMGGDGMYSYNWTPASTLNNAMIADPLATPPGPTTYTVDVTDAEGNMASDSVTVYLKNQALNLDPMVCTTYDFPYETDPKTVWAWNAQTKTLCQTVNGAGSALFCGWELNNAVVEGEFAVNENGGDDDWTGFMWGVQDTSHFYVFTWKQAAQNFPNCGGALPVGMQVKVVDVQDAMTNPLACQDLHKPAATANSKVLLAPADLSTAGWKDSTAYIFTLTHKASGEMTIVVKEKLTNVVIANKTFMDTTYPSGKFGMYTKSQVSACFSNYTTTCVP